MDDQPIHQEKDIPPVEVRTAGMMLIWKCTNCGYIFPQNKDIPENCPECGKHKEYFERIQED